MGLIKAMRDWGTVTIDTDAGTVSIREDWQYTWRTQAGAKPFNITQKRAFHNRVDREIWGKWSWKFHVYSIGPTPFAKQYAKQPLVLNFDIRWVLHNGQWQVEVIRVRPGTKMNNNTRSNVTFATRNIQLYSLLFTPYTAGNDAGQSRPGFKTPPHEFGHTLNYPDDYNATSTYLSDTESLMNIGQQLRQRHIYLVMDTLNTMIPGVTFRF